MIPRAHITAWRSQAPWPTDAQVEQDLVLTRALTEIFKWSAIAKAVAFRGGTALHKLYFEHPGRYSEDIDLVQIEAGPIGHVLDAIRERLDPWMGEPRRKRGHGRVTIVYRFDTTLEPRQQMRLKIEINTRSTIPRIVSVVTIVLKLLFLKRGFFIHTAFFKFFPTTTWARFVSSNFR